MEITKILDTTIADSGPQQDFPEGFLRSNKPLRIHPVLGSGDIIVIEGRLSAEHSYGVLHTFTDSTPADVFPSFQMRARRTTDGGNDSEIHVQNPYPDIELTTHTS